MPEPSRPIRVGIVNDYEIVVSGLAAVLAPFDEIDVVELDSRKPVISEVDVVLYDSFGQVQGAAIDLESLTTSHPVKVVVFSWNTKRDLVQQTLDAGVAGYLSKSVSADELVDAVRRVHGGETVSPPDDADQDDQLGSWPGQEQGLSARESEVLALICQGFSNEEISGRVFIGANTVKSHIRSLYRKIGVDSRTRALLWGIDHGFRPDRSRTIEEQPDR